MNMGLVARACADLNLSKRVRRRATALRPRTQRRTRASVASGCVYLAALLEGERRTQSQVAKKLGVSKDTVRVNYQALLPSTPCEFELERQNGRAFCSESDNWCGSQGNIIRCVLRKNALAKTRRIVQGSTEERR